ncbi:phage tail protein [Nocardia sp. CC227C]|uniref:Gp37-like protein n=1 Tax=Nocardia sp. CC227C TaxID=3044562 RepID=UPI00278C72D4|nr:phage tail protein [Nocardia sp. CC227C]
MDLLRKQEQDDWRDQDVVVRYYDKWMQEIGEEHRYTYLQFSHVANAPGGLKMICPPDIVHYDHFFRNPDGADATIPITVSTRGQRWDGFVTRAAEVVDENGLKTIEIEAIHCWQHIATTVCWANPFAPLFAMWPRHWYMFGGVRSIIHLTLIANYLRRQAFWSADQWRGAPDWAEVGSIAWPIAVGGINVLTDTSPFRGVSLRFEHADHAFLPLVKDTGVFITAEFYLPDLDDEQPDPEWMYLDRPTVFITTVDKSNVVGATGTMLDGISRLFEEFFEDGTSSIRYPDLSAAGDYEIAYATTPFGNKRYFPWIWYMEGEYSGIGTSDISIHKPLAVNVLVGGKSPGWVNAAIEIAIKNALAWLGLLIGVPGLDSLYMGQLDHVFLAFAQYTDQGRLQRAGPFAFNEHFVTGSDKAFTIDGLMAGLQGLHDTRGYTSKKVTVHDNAPYILGPRADFWLGDQIGFQVGDLLFVDYVTEATFTDDRTTPGRWEIVVGDGADEEDSVVKAWQRLGTVANAIKQIFMDVGADLDLIIF